MNFLTLVQDIGFAAAPARTVNRLDYERRGTVTSVEVALEDLVLVTTGSQAADLSAGSMTEVPSPRPSGRSWALWERLAQGRRDFGNPEVFFGTARIPDSLWVTFTVTDTGPEFINQIAALTGSRAGLGGLATLKDSGWVLSLSVFHQPEIIGQPKGMSVWWGYGLHPERNGDFVRKPMTACTGAEILEETLRQLRFDRQLAAIMASSICVPCYMPYVNNIWLPRSRGNRPPPVLEGAANLGLIGQYVEVPKEIAFTIECSVRTAWEAISRVLDRGPAPPPVYQGQYDPRALFAALKVFVSGTPPIVAYSPGAAESDRSAADGRQP
ncbi:MAG TPA: oleate hydratase [Stellaceae bacterium]